MATIPRTGAHTFADFLELVPEDQKADLLDGVIYMASPESIEHNDVVVWLGFLLHGFIEERGLGKLSVNKVAYRLSHHTSPEPDLAFIRTERLGLRKHGYVDGPPDLAVEFVSPDSVQRDYEHKRRKYEEAGVQEYWIIDPDERRATFLVRGAHGFEEALPAGDVYESRIVPGFRLDVRWLWQRPLPRALTILQNLLSHGEPR